MPDVPEALEISTPNHMALQTADVMKLVGFYYKVLGFKEVEPPMALIEEFGGRWLAHPNGKLMIHVIKSNLWSQIQAKNPNTKSIKDLEGRDKFAASKYGGRPMDLRVAGEDHLSFPVPDFEKAIEILGKHNIPIHADRRGKQGWFADPDGRTIEFGEYGPTPPFKKSYL